MITPFQAVGQRDQLVDQVLVYKEGVALGSPLEVVGIADTWAVVGRLQSGVGTWGMLGRLAGMAEGLLVGMLVLVLQDRSQGSRVEGLQQKAAQQVVQLQVQAEYSSPRPVGVPPSYPLCREHNFQESQSDHHRISSAE